MPDPMTAIFCRSLLCEVKAIDRVRSGAETIGRFGVGYGLCSVLDQGEPVAGTARTSADAGMCVHQCASFNRATASREGAGDE